MGFLPQVAAIVRHLPAERQTMLFSATLDGEVGRLAADLCREPLRLRLEDVATADEEPLSLRLEHRFEACARGERGERLAGLIGAEPGLVLVFCRTRHGAGRLAKRLSAQGVRADAMHGDLTQGARERALRAFAGGRSRVLVATDVAARGIDLDDVALVVNFDPPDSREAYTHRVGRTARAGRTGRAVTLVEPDQADDVGRIATALGLDEAWAATGYDAPAPKVVYGSRRRGSAFAPGRPPRRTAAAADAPRRANRVRRGTRTRVTPGS
jgi:ATP-dependent RNA helicase RhlE